MDLDLIKQKIASAEEELAQFIRQAELAIASRRGYIEALKELLKSKEDDSNPLPPSKGEQAQK